MKFKNAMKEMARYKIIKKGELIILIPTILSAHQQIVASINKEVKMNLVKAHFERIKMSDEVLVCNVGGYIGHETLVEFVYATMLNKSIKFLEEIE